MGEGIGEQEMNEFKHNDDFLVLSNCLCTLV